MKYVYCLTRNIESTDEFPSGLGDMKVYQVKFQNTSVLVSNMDCTELQLDVRILDDIQNVLVHQKVVQKAWELSISIIPCRFGTILASEEKIISLLEKHYEILENELKRLEDKLEVSVRAIFSESDIKEAKREEVENQKSNGIKYLLEKKEKFDVVRELDAKAKKFKRRLNEATESLWTEIKTQKRSLDNGLLFSIYYLMDRDSLSPFRLSYQHFKEKHPELNLLYTGPWPPYSFTEVNLSIQNKLDDDKLLC